MHHIVIIVLHICIPLHAFKSICYILFVLFYALYAKHSKIDYSLYLIHKYLCIISGDLAAGKPDVVADDVDLGLSLLCVQQPHTAGVIIGS